MKKIFFKFPAMGFLLVLCSFLSAQNYNLSGEVTDPEGQPLEYATVALLDPSDSTLVNVCITAGSGRFQFDKVQPGNYILQLAFIGFQTSARNINVPQISGNLGTIILKVQSKELEGVIINAERIPILIRDDTVEYNALSYKTRPDAVAEDLLRKLPGLEVDRDGNIKAMGVDVKQVLVDGKEFFTADPKVATKNLPAESINKVQVYDKKSDDAELLGIEDTELDKTINFVLKENAKKAVLGDIQAGAGLPEYYQAKSKVYRFTEKNQFAMLGMINNINKPGFSFEDYLDFNGGLRNALSGGNGFQLSVEENYGIPVNLGQQVNGQLTSGALGFNYSYEPVKNNRFNISFMGNGSKLEEKKEVYSYNLTGTDAFEQSSNEEGKGTGFNQLLNLGWRNKSNAKQHYIVNGFVSLQNNRSVSDAIIENSLNGEPVSSLDQSLSGSKRIVTARADGTWLRKLNENWKMIKLNGSIGYTGNLNESNWINLLEQSGFPEGIENREYNKNYSNIMRYEGKVTTLRTLGSGYYLEPSLAVGYTDEYFDRKQGLDSEPRVFIDSLSPIQLRDYFWYKPGIFLKKYSKKWRLTSGFEYLSGWQQGILNGENNPILKVSSLLPRVSWNYEFKTGRRLGVEYISGLNMPAASQLLPVISTSNPMKQYFGNPSLKNEFRQSLIFSWLLFDQFSFTSLFAGVNGTIIKNKINQSIIIDDDFRQCVTLVNVPEDYSASAFLDFSTPVRFLGINTGLSFRERINRGMSPVNSEMNINCNYTHELKLKFDNRKKDIWDVEFGGRIVLTKANYSIMRELNTKYYNYGIFGDIRCNPTEHWHFRLAGDLTSFNSPGYMSGVSIPILSADMTYFISKNKRAALIIEAVDMLNRNTGIERITELNYFREERSATIGRYFMFSFRYKLNQTDGDRELVRISAR